MTKTQIIKQLKEAGLWEKRYISILDRLFELDELIQIARDSIKNDGINLFSERGSKKNPAIDMVSALYREYRFCASMLKLSPKDSKTDAKPEDDGFDDI